MRARKLALLAVMTATALILSVVENQFPLLPGIAGAKLGLANIVTLLCLMLWGWREAGIVLLARILLAALFSGHPSSLFYSLAGGFCCLVVMGLAKGFLSERQIWFLSVLGALAHNAGQMLMALLILRTPLLLWYAPVLALLALPTGLFTGLCAQMLVPRLKRFV